VLLAATADCRGVLTAASSAATAAAAAAHQPGGQALRVYLTRTSCTEDLPTNRKTNAHDRYVVRH
jgi:hypothetical protein